jgi:hypothetical protein
MTTTVKLIILAAVILGEALMLAILAPRMIRQDKAPVAAILAFASLATIVIVAVVLFTLV